jgi:hypothetical protein
MLLGNNMVIKAEGELFQVGFDRKRSESCLLLLGLGLICSCSPLIYIKRVGDVIFMATRNKHEIWRMEETNQLNLLFLKLRVIKDQMSLL